MSEHTSLPWEVKDDHMVINPWSMEYVADCGLNDPGDPDTSERWQANAEYIVLAFNAFPELVAALEAAYRLLGDGSNGTWCHSDARIRAALKKARGES